MPTAAEAAEALTAEIEDPLHVLDPRNLRVQYQNTASLDLFGSLSDQAALDALIDPGEVEFQTPLRNVLRLLTRKGRRAYLLSVREYQGWQVQILKDISDLDLQLDDLCRGLQLDPETQVLNRRALMYALVREMARAERSGEPLHYLVIRVGGSEVAAVQAIADLLRSTLRQTDIIGRCDQDRLALILPCTDAAGAAWVAQRSLELAQGARPQSPVKLSTGFAEFRSGDTSEDMALRAREQIDV